MESITVNNVARISEISYKKHWKLSNDTVVKMHSLISNTWFQRTSRVYSTKQQKIKNTRKKKKNYRKYTLTLFFFILKFSQTMFFLFNRYLFIALKVWVPFLFFIYFLYYIQQKLNQLKVNLVFYLLFCFSYWDLHSELF